MAPSVRRRGTAVLALAMASGMSLAASIPAGAATTSAPAYYQGVTSANVLSLALNLPIPLPSVPQHAAVNLIGVTGTALHNTLATGSKTMSESTATLANGSLVQALPARVPQFCACQDFAIGSHAARDQHTAVGKHGSGMKGAGRRSACAEQLRALTLRIENFRRLNQLPVCADAAKNQHRAIRQHRGSVAGASHLQCSLQFPLIALRIAQPQGGAGMAGRILPSGEQNSPIGQKGGCLPVCRCHVTGVRLRRHSWYAGNGCRDASNTYT